MSNATLPADRINARRYFGETAPEFIIEAKARCYAWRPFAMHTAEEVAEHKADLTTCDTYEAAIVPVAEETHCEPRTYGHDGGEDFARGA